MPKEKVEKTIIFEKYPIPKAVLTLCIPTIITQIIMIIYNYADTFYIGHSGESSQECVAALGFAMPVFVIMGAIANLFGVGGASLIARFLGRKEFDKAKNTFAFSVYGAILAALIYSLTIFIFHKPIIYLITGNGATYDLIYRYMVITMIFGGLPTILNNLFGHLVRSIGAAFHSSIGMSLGGILNLLLDPLFIFVIMKDDPIGGAAIATLISNITATLYFIVYIILNKKNISTLTLNPKDISIKNGILKEVLLIGLPAALGTFLAMISNIVANNLVNTPQNIPAIAGLNVAKKANLFAFSMLMGMTQGMLPFIAYNYASGNHERRIKGIKAMFTVAISFALIMMLVYIFFREPILTFFLPGNTDAINYGSEFLFYLSFAVPLCAISYSTATIFQAIGRKTFAFILSILRKGLFDIPLMYGLKYLTPLKTTGVLLATPAAEILSVMVAVILLIISNKQNKKLLNNLGDEDYE